MAYSVLILGAQRVDYHIFPNIAKTDSQLRINIVVKFIPRWTSGHIFMALVPNSKFDQYPKTILVWNVCITVLHQAYRLDNYVVWMTGKNTRTRGHCIYLNQNGLIYSTVMNVYFGGLVQDYRISSKLAIQILQSCTKPSIWFYCLFTDQRYSWFEYSWCVHHTTKIIPKHVCWGLFSPETHGNGL